MEISIPNKKRCGNKKKTERKPKDICSKLIYEDHTYSKPITRHATNSDQDTIMTCQTQVEFLKEELEKTKNKLDEARSKTITIDTIKDFSVWTNLPNRDVFNALVEYLKSRGGGDLKYWRVQEHSSYRKAGMMKKPGPPRTLSFEEELFLVLVKLKTGLNNSELSQLTNISETTVGVIFTTFVNFMCVELSLLFEMPEPDDENICDCFIPFSGLQVVLDCTEFSVEKSSNLQARKELYSNYKGRETIKFMVGLSPNLYVNYVSKAFGGRASDKFITLQSTSLLDALPEGSKVMVDRGFNVGDELKALGVDLIIPTFKGAAGKRSQMRSDELAHSENVAMARIHVERIIQRIRSFQILEKRAKLSSKDIYEQLFKTCAYLANFQLPIVRK